jgi:hypothetical protein
MNAQTAASLVRLGIKARFMPLGYVPENEIFQFQPDLSGESSIRGLPHDFARPVRSLDAPLSDRGIDVLFVGTNSERRQGFFADHSEFFASNNCFIRLVDIVGVLPADHPSSISPRGFAGLAQRSKILLNVHHFGTPYFEWQRLMHYGIMQRCCVVTEKSSQVPGLVPDRHYFHDEAHMLPALMEWLLHDRDGQEQAERVSRAGYHAAIEQFQLARTLRELFAIEDPA